MQKDFVELSQIAEFYLNELNIRYNVTKLVQEVGEITSVVQNEDEISSAVAGVMSKRLDYARGAILLAKNDQSSLYFAGGYGFAEDEIELLNTVEFRLDNSATEGILQKVFNRQEPQLVEDICKIAHMFDTKNRSLVKKLQVQAMVCVPIIHEDESLGVMAVDSIEPHREFREGDINLLMAIASQTGLSIAHAKAFQQLQESEKKHRVLVETIRDIVYTVDMEGRFTYISPMVEVITGYEDKDLMGRNFSEVVTPSYREKALQRFEKVLETDETSRYEIEITGKDGRSVPFEINTAPLSDIMGNTIGRIGVARDITERTLEQKKRKEMEIKALTQDKLASLGEIATGIAHEINQPLSYIKIILEATLKDIEAAKVESHELSEEFNESLRQIGKISSIISHLRTFGRSDVISFGPVKLSRVLDDTLILMHKRLKIKNISFDSDIADNLPMLHGNHIKLEQVFINLIQNSLDAMEEQGRGTIILKARADNSKARISYTDTGKGIASKFHEKIFDPFFSTKEPGKGTGIGLAIVFGIIQEHNGEITCESNEGTGARFEITLPVHVEESVF
jgi:PAS domain S-box-containing protein